VKEQLAYDRFYAKYITISIFGYAIVSGAVFNGTMKAITSGGSDISWWFLPPWIFFSSLYALCIYLFCFASSRTISINRLIFFRLRSLQAGICQLKILKFHRRIVHLDLVNEYKLLLLKACARLVTSQPLNNRLFFFEIGGLVSVMFMAAVRRQNNTYEK